MYRDIRGETTERDDEGLAIPPNNQGFIKPVQFDAEGIQFRGTGQNDTSACDPEFAPTCGNTSRLVLNELLNYCFVNVSLGLNKQELHLVTQDQVNTLSDICNGTTWPSSDEFIRTCCQQVTTSGASGVFIRRDLLLLAGCRATTHAINNGDGKHHRPSRDITSDMYQGKVASDDSIPFNFDYQV